MKMKMESKTSLNNQSIEKEFLDFNNLIQEISNIGKDWHEQTIVKNSEANKNYFNKTIKDLLRSDNGKKNTAIVVNAGPSLHYNNSLETIATSDFDGNIIAIDGSYVKCLKAGVIPDYVLTLDPHPSRMVRWFGDPDFEENMGGDDYFTRQDLDIDFRENSVRANEENIRLVNEFASQTKLIIASTSPVNMVDRSIKAGFDMYWWMPLVDNPKQENSITRRIYDITKLPALNTGGNVGTSAWVFAQFWLNVDFTAVIGTDLGYKQDLPYTMTQTYPELLSLLGEGNVSKDYFPEFIYPQTGEIFYSDPTYTWYKYNFLDLIKNSGVDVFNCTEGGTFTGDGVNCISLREFISKFG
jgi:hypothetical protein